MCLVASDGNITRFNISMPETHLNNIQKLSPLDRNSTRPIQILDNISFIMTSQTKGKEKYLPAFTFNFPYHKNIVLTHSA